ncbi:nitric oxide associated protein 1 [Blastocladiella emersonii ATCC 22665]|nr:nitric oxide associated protein 1 [Blastocladiella emersonii ATCC 22665]
MVVVNSVARTAAIQLRTIAATPGACQANVPAADPETPFDEAPEEGFSRYDLERQKCTGCGAQYQFDRPDAAGYLTDARLDAYKKNLERAAALDAQRPDPAELEAAVAKSVVDWKYTSKSQRKKHLRKAKTDEVVAQLVCQRCHDITHTNTTALAGPPEVTPATLDLRKVNRSLFIQLVDILDFPASHFSLRGVIPPHTPYLLVFNKSDLLPQSATPERLRQWAEHFSRRLKQTPAGVHVISSKSGAGIRPMFDQIQQLRSRYNLRDVYLLGATNVGKSEFINCLHRMVRFPKSAGSVTTSRLPGTTVANLPIPLARFGGLMHASGAVPSAADASLRGQLLDTPGLTLPARLTNVLTDPRDLRLAHAVKRLEPVTFRVPRGKSIFLGGLARLDYVDGSCASRLGLTVWAPHMLPIHITSIEKANKFCGLSDAEIAAAEADQDLEWDPAVDGDLATWSGRDVDDAAAGGGVKEDENHFAPALKLDLFGGSSTPVAPAEPEPTPATTPEPEPAVPLDPIEPALFTDLPAARDPLPAILSPPSPHARSGVPAWSRAGQWIVRGDGLKRAWADIAFGGVGWISVSGEFDRGVFRAYTRGGVGAMRRDPLMPFDFGYPMKKVE